MYRLYSEKISFLDNERTYKKYYDLLSDDRKKKTDAYRFDKDKKLSVLAEALLRRDLKTDAVINYRYGENGKPYLKDFKDVFFSYSHSGEYAICAVSDKEIGCDIEMVKDVDFNIAKRFFTKSEYENIAKLEDIEAKKDLFFRYWTIKESYIKATGQGLKCSLDSFEAMVIPTPYKIIENADFFGYKCAICTKM